MLGVILILLLFGALLTALFWASTLFIQAYLYNEPAPDLYWRAPAAAGALTVFLAIWCILAYRGIGGGFDPLFFSPEQSQDFPRFWSVEKGKDKVLYERHKTAGVRTTVEYVVPGSQPPRRWRRIDPEGKVVDTIIVEEGEGEKKKEVRFKLVLTKEDEAARYLEEGGSRVMTEDRVGRVSIRRTSTMVGYLVLNTLHYVVWFVCLWLLLRYQLWHALLLAAGCWLLLTLWVVPQVLEKSKQAAPPRASTAALARAGET